MTAKFTFLVNVLLLQILLGVADCQTVYKIQVVDDFSVASFPMKVSGPSLPVVGVSGAGNLGGSRLVALQTNQGPISCISDQGGLLFDVVGTKASNSQEYIYQQSAELIYDGNEYPLNPNGLGRVDLDQGEGPSYFQISFSNTGQTTKSK